MSPIPLPPTVRLSIAFWPDDAPHGAVAAFCREYGISRKAFYVLRARALEDGPNAVLEPRSSAPESSPHETSPDTVSQALQVRQAREEAGLDHGPISVHDVMEDLGLTAPSPATLARIFHAHGAIDPQPRKRPRSAFRRFVYPAPNSLWQIDATEYRLSRGRKCVIFQVIDDHSRLIVASLIAGSETSEAAVRVVTKAITLHGVPQRILSDNGVALNPTRRGYDSQLVKYGRSLGIEMITGRNRRPTTQGKTERVHQTLFRWLDKQPFAETHDQLQSQVDEFDRIYNTERRHQSLAERMTPQQAWEKTPKAAAPVPPIPDKLREGSAKRIIHSRGTVTVLATAFKIGPASLAGTAVFVTWNEQTVTVFDESGTELRSFPRPPKGTSYVGNGEPAGFMRNQQLSPTS